MSVECASSISIYSVSISGSSRYSISSYPTGTASWPGISSLQHLLDTDLEYINIHSFAESVLGRSFPSGRTLYSLPTVLLDSQSYSQRALPT